MKAMFKTMFLRVLFVAFGLILGASYAAAQKPGGSFIIAVEAEPRSASGHMDTLVQTWMIASNIFSGLVGLDMNFNPTPDLADSWTISPDGRVYTFNLNPNAKFHDGKPVTAEDVAYTFNEIISKTHPRASSWWPLVESAKATGPHTFVFTLKQPFAPFMSLLGFKLVSGAVAMPKHLYEGKDPLNNPINQAPIGSGPFKFVRWVRGSHVELEKNPNYFRAGRPFLDRLVIQFLPNPASRLLAFERGDVDYLHWYLTPHEHVARLKADPRFEIVETGGEAASTIELLLLNNRGPQLRHKEVRQAIAYAIDRDALRNTVMYGTGKTAQSILSSGMGKFHKPVYEKYAKRDLQKAGALLDAAGFKAGPDGKRFPLRLTWAAGRDFEGRIAEFIKSQLAAVGIDVRIETFDRATTERKIFHDWDFDLAPQLWTTGPDPTIAITPRYHTKAIVKASSVNGMGFSNVPMDAILDKESSELDAAKRFELWHQVQDIVGEEAPVLPLFEMPQVNVVNAKFKNVLTTPYGYIDARTETYVVQ